MKNFKGGIDAKRNTGEGEQVHYDDLTCEVYGPHGIAMVVEMNTDNRNRTAVSKLIESLEDHDDVKEVYSNGEFAAH